MGAPIVRRQDRWIVCYPQFRKNRHKPARGLEGPVSLTPVRDSAVMLGCSTYVPDDTVDTSPLEFLRPGNWQRLRRQRRRHDYETHLSSIEDSPRTRPWLSRSHEDPWWTRRRQRTPGQRAQTPFRLIASQGSVPGQGCAAMACKRVMRMRHSVDFERVLARPAVVANRHFALHCLDSEPCARFNRRSDPPKTILSTVDDPPGNVSVYKVSLTGLHALASGCIWLGIVVPKRYARRAVTRTLLKRQIRCGVERHMDCFPNGMWVIRLRAPFDRPRYVAAAPEPLRATLRREVDQLLETMKTSKLDVA